MERKDIKYTVIFLAGILLTAIVVTMFTNEPQQLIDAQRAVEEAERENMILGDSVVQMQIKVRRDSLVIDSLYKELDTLRILQTQLLEDHEKTIGIIQSGSIDSNLLFLSERYRLSKAGGH